MIQTILPCATLLVPRPARQSRHQNDSVHMQLYVQNVVHTNVAHKSTFACLSALSHTHVYGFIHQYKSSGPKQKSTFRSWMKKTCVTDSTRPLARLSLTFLEFLLVALEFPGRVVPWHVQPSSNDNISDWPIQKTAHLYGVKQLLHKALNISWTPRKANRIEKYTWNHKGSWRQLDGGEPNYL